MRAPPNQHFTPVSKYAQTAAISSLFSKGRGGLPHTHASALYVVASHLTRIPPNLEQPSCVPFIHSVFVIVLQGDPQGLVPGQPERALRQRQPDGAPGPGGPLPEDGLAHHRQQGSAQPVRVASQPHQGPGRHPAAAGVPPEPARAAADFADNIWQP